MCRSMNVTRASPDDNTRCARHATQGLLGEPVNYSTAGAPQTVPPAAPRATTATPGHARRSRFAIRNNRAHPGSSLGADAMRFCGHRREAVRHQVPFCTPPKTVRAPVLSGRRTDDESRLPSSTITKAMPDADTHEKLAPFRRLVARFSLSETAKYTKLALGLWIGFAIPSVLGFPDAALSLAGSAMFTLALESSISAARSYFFK
jgi:hypothetical protein